MKTLQVVAAIIQHDGYILATQRGYGDFAGGWEFPGGKIEPDEDPEAALVREIREELDAEILVDRLLITVQYDYPAFRLNMQCFVCTLQSDFTLLEHSAGRWLDAATLHDVDWLPADIQVVEAIEAEHICTTHESQDAAAE